MVLGPQVVQVVEGPQVVVQVVEDPQAAQELLPLLVVVEGRERNYLGSQLFHQEGPGTAFPWMITTSGRLIRETTGSPWTVMWRCTRLMRILGGRENG